MTDLLQQAFDAASGLPADEQDRVAEWLIAEIRSEHRWDEAFANSQATLEKLAAEAMPRDQCPKGSA